MGVNPQLLSEVSSQPSPSTHPFGTVPLSLQPVPAVESSTHISTGRPSMLQLYSTSSLTPTGAGGGGVVGGSVFLYHSRSGPKVWPCSTRKSLAALSQSANSE